MPAMGIGGGIVSTVYLATLVYFMPTGKWIFINLLTNKEVTTKQLIH